MNQVVYFPITACLLPYPAPFINPSNSARDHVVTAGLVCCCPSNTEGNHVKIRRCHPGLRAASAECLEDLPFAVTLYDGRTNWH